MPKDWRKTSVTPGLKKGKEEDLGNCRPIRLTFLPGKVMEQLVLGAFSKCVEEERLITSCECGLSKGKSCLINLIAFSDGTACWIDEGKAVDVIYLNFSRAFDTVSHGILTAKLKKCRLNDWVVRWIVNWLKYRAQRVVVCGAV